MKAYVATTGALFLLLTVAHVWRATQETHLARDPWFLCVTIVTCVLSLWSLQLYRKAARP